MSPLSPNYATLDTFGRRTVCVLRVLFVGLTLAFSRARPRASAATRVVRSRYTVATASPPFGVSVPYLPARRISIIHIGVQLCRPSLETARLQLTESREILEKAIRPTRVPCGVFHSL